MTTMHEGRGDSDQRPSAEEMLARVKADAGDGRGRLRVYLGMAPGVGKTYTMLEEAHRRAERGTDLVIGFVESYGRPRTLELLEGLETIPRRRVEYRGVVLEEMDTDAVIGRKPAVALVDEYAHTNVPGSERTKRWQDVEAIRDAGIDVVSTLNIQHLDSVADAVVTITGSPVHERIPDTVLASADEIQLVDMSPRALRQRMRHGNVYPPDRVRVALDRFFTEANLTALRELALRYTAAAVDTQLRGIMGVQGVAGSLPVTARVAALVDTRGASRSLLRRAAELAAAVRGELLAIAVDTPADTSRGRDRDQDLRENLEYAEELGAEILRREAANVAGGVADAARERRITHLVLPYRPRAGLRAAFGRALADDLIEQLPDVEVILVGSRGG